MSNYPLANYPPPPVGGIRHTMFLRWLVQLAVPGNGVLDCLFAHVLDEQTMSQAAKQTGKQASKQASKQAKARLHDLWRLVYLKFSTIRPRKWQPTSTPKQANLPLVPL